MCVCVRVCVCACMMCRWVAHSNLVLIWFCSSIAAFSIWPIFTALNVLHPHPPPPQPSYHQPLKHSPCTITFSFLQGQSADVIKGGLCVPRRAGLCDTRKAAQRGSCLASHLLSSRRPPIAFVYVCSVFTVPFRPSEGSYASNTSVFHLDARFARFCGISELKNAFAHCLWMNIQIWSHLLKLKEC